MSYTSFIDLSDVCEKFNLSYEQKEFIKESKFNCETGIFNYIKSNFLKTRSFINETAICESIIAPILSVVADFNELPLWSHTPLNVDEKLNLSGTPDFILAPAITGGQRFKTPVICLVEAKRDDFIAGWAQAGAEMVASQMKNKDNAIPIYGIVSTGKFWEFGVLQDKKITIDPNSITAPKHIDELFDSLNWLFAEGKKNANILNGK